MPVYIDASNVITSLGFSTIENFNAMEQGLTGISYTTDFCEVTIPASIVDKERLLDECTAEFKNDTTTFEKLALLSTQKALEQSNINPSDARTIFILSTTKGNVSLLKEKGTNHQNERLFLWHTAERLRNHFHNPNKAIVISNACISGLSAIITAQRLILSGLYDHAVVTGADELSPFVVSGFRSFLSLSANPCKPFDRDRDGLTLGEGAGTLVLTNQKPGLPYIEVSAGASANDANHISGPSRTGEGLLLAISQTLAATSIIPDFISAHGTATPYNDDMESVAINRAGFNQVPVNSIKGFIGHTLGAAGIIESIIGAHCLKQNLVLKTMGLTIAGVAQPINILSENLHMPLKSFIKATSGFGGSNAAALFTKHE